MFELWVFSSHTQIAYRGGEDEMWSLITRVLLPGKYNGERDRIRGAEVTCKEIVVVLDQEVLAETEGEAMSRKLVGTIDEVQWKSVGM